MSESDKIHIEWLKTFRNQMIALVAASIVAGLVMTYKFMSTIELTMKNTNENVNFKFMNVDKQFDVVGKRIDKVEDKVDGIYKYNVPENSQVQEPRKKDPNF